MKISRRTFIVGGASTAIIAGAALALGIPQEIGAETSSLTPYEERRRFYYSKNYVLKKRLLSWVNSYDVEVESKNIAEITQDYWTLVKYFQIKTRSGEYLGHISEVPNLWGHISEVFDENDRKIGELRQDLSQLFTNPGLYLDVLDEGKRKSAIIDQNLMSWVTHFDIYDPEHRKIIGKIEGVPSFSPRYAIGLEQDANLDRRILLSAAAMIDAISETKTDTDSGDDED
jgi:hypothetical protein